MFNSALDNDSGWGSCVARRRLLCTTYLFGILWAGLRCCVLPQTTRSRAVLKGYEKGFIMPTETNLHGDALCFMVKTWARHKTTKALLNSGWRLVAVGGWGRLAVGGGWQLAVGGWWLVVPRGCP